MKRRYADSTRLVHEAVAHIPTLDELKARLVAAGWRVSVGSYANEVAPGHHRVYAFSVESAGPGTYGHSAASLSFTEDWKKPGTGWINGRL